MAYTYDKRKQRHNNIIYTIIATIVILTLFAGIITSFYFQAEDEAYEMLHIQTKQIKDDISLQIKSDTENLVTMANFASKLYARGQDYSLMFDSFNPIGLFSRIGILTPDCIFMTKDETIDLKGRISFEKEAQMGKHVTGRTYSYSRPGEEVVRSAVPIEVNGKTVGMIYGVIEIETINEKYNNMAKELDAQLFVYDKETGKFIIDTINNPPGELSDLKDREYNDGYTYEELATTDKGFTSFKSIRTGEELYLHYSIIEDLDWGIMLARYETQVFAKTHNISLNLIITFAILVLVFATYLYAIIAGEKRKNKITSASSDIRKNLLEANKQNKNIDDALKNIKEFLNARSAFFADTDGEGYNYNPATINAQTLKDEDRKFFISELLRYAAKIYSGSKSSIGYLSIVPDEHLKKTNEDLYSLLKKYIIDEISFVYITEKNNHTSILGVTNSKNKLATKDLLEDTAICFSIAIFNKKHLNKTELAAITDSLTGALNRVSYKEDVLSLDKERPKDFSCIYIDVNELHLMNNKFGHAAGDEMLIYIANTLKEVFYGHRIYRMGGDEFLVFTKDLEQSAVKEKISVLVEELNEREYKVAIGTSYRTQNNNCEEMVREAEIRMYEAKAQYYQNKENTMLSNYDDNGYKHLKTGIREVDTMISILKDHYNGIYRVSLDTDNVHRILMPSYLGYDENEQSFSKKLTKYINDSVHPDYHRAVLSFLNYEAIRKQLSANKIPSITYRKTNGDTVILSVYKLSDENDAVRETLWVFAKD